MTVRRSRPAPMEAAADWLLVVAVATVVVVVVVGSLLMFAKVVCATFAISWSAAELARADSISSAAAAADDDDGPSPATWGDEWCDFRSALLPATASPAAAAAAAAPVGGSRSGDLGRTCVAFVATLEWRL